MSEPSPHKRAMGARIITNRSRYIAFLASTLMQKLGQLVLLVGVAGWGTAIDVFEFGMFISWLALAVPLFTLNIHMSVGRMYFTFPHEGERLSYALTSLIVSISSTVLCISLFFVLYFSLTGSELFPWTNFSIFYVLLPCTLIFVVNQFFGVFIRLADLAVPYFWFGALTGAGAVTLYFIGIVTKTPPLISAVAAYSGAQLVAVTYCVATNRRILSAKLRLAPIRSGFSYSVGTVVYALVQWVTSYSGRWLGAESLPIEHLSAYTLIGQGILAYSMVVTNFYEAERTRILRQYSRNRQRNGKKLIDTQFRRSIVLTIIAFTFATPSLSLINLALPDHLQIDIIWMACSFILCISYCFSIRTYWISIGLMKTKIFGAAAVLGAMVNLVVVLTSLESLGVTALLLASATGLIVQGTAAELALRQSRPLPERE